MSFKDLKILAFKNPIVNEADRPNRPAANMKEVFDANSQELREALNSVIDAADLAVRTVRDDLGDKQFLRGDGTYGVPQASEAANGVPSRGEKGQTLVKASGSDFDLKWDDTEHTHEKTLLASSWAGKRYTLAVDGVAEKSVVEILPPLSDAITDKQLETLQAANLQDGGQSAGSVVLVARGDVPEIDVPIRVVVRGNY